MDDLFFDESLNLIAKRERIEIKEFKTYRAAKRYADTFKSKVDGPFFDFDGNSYYTVVNHLHRFNFKTKQ